MVASFVLVSAGQPSCGSLSLSLSLALSHQSGFIVKRNMKQQKKLTLQVKQNKDKNNPTLNSKHYTHKENNTVF